MNPIRSVYLVILLWAAVVSAQSYRLSNPDIIKLRHNNFTDRFLKSVSTAGYLFCSTDDMIRLKKSNIDETTILEYSRKKIRIKVHDLERLRKANFSRSMISLLIDKGYSPTLSVDQMIEMKKNRVSEEQIRIQAYGPKNANS